MNNPIPPLVTFEERFVEDREKFIETGRPSEKAVIYVIIQQAGSHDTTEKVADEWLKQIAEYSLRHGGTSAAYPPDWIDAWKHKLDLFKKGQEIPEDGTPIRLCPIFNKQQIAAITNANIHTLEALVSASTEGLTNIGMGAIELKQRAEKYMEEANGSGKLVMENEKLRKKVENQQEEMDVLKRQMAELTALVQDKPKKKAEAA